MITRVPAQGVTVGNTCGFGRVDVAKRYFDTLDFIVYFVVVHDTAVIEEVQLGGFVFIRCGVCRDVEVTGMRTACGKRFGHHLDCIPIYRIICSGANHRTGKARAYRGRQSLLDGKEIGAVAHVVEMIPETLVYRLSGFVDNGYIQTGRQSAEVNGYGFGGSRSDRTLLITEHVHGLDVSGHRLIVNSRLHPLVLER